MFNQLLNARQGLTGGFNKNMKRHLVLLEHIVLSKLDNSSSKPGRLNISGYNLFINFNNLYRPLKKYTELFKNEWYPKPSENPM